MCIKVKCKSLALIKAVLVTKYFVEQLLHNLIKRSKLLINNFLKVEMINMENV